jgi:carbonic anhydrase
MSDPHESDSFKFLYSWVSIAQPIKNRIIEEYVSKADRFVACEKASIVQSLDNLKTFPWIKERVESERLWLHGWYYDLTSGKLLIYSPEQKKFETFRH